MIVTPSGVTAVSEAGAFYLLIPPSPTMTALGDIGVCLPSNDTYAAYYNPANGVMPFEGVSLSRSSVALRWLPNLVHDFTYSYHVANVALPVGELVFGRGVFSLGFVFSRHKTYLDLGEQERTGEGGEVLGTFSSSMKAEAFTVGVRTQARFGKIPVDVSVGTTRKRAVQMLAGPETPGGKSSNVFRDHGVLVSVPLLFQKISPLNDRFGIAFTPSFGYSVSNIGDRIAFIDAAQADPSPRYLRIGLAWSAAVSDRSGWNIVLYRGGRAASDLLVGSSPPRDYQRGLGDVSFMDHVIRNRPDTRVVVHRGHEWTFLDLLSLRSGRKIDHDGKINLRTSGYGFRVKGILDILYYVFEEPAFQTMSDFVDVQYNVSKWSEAPDHPLNKTRYGSVTFTVKNIEKLLALVLEKVRSNPG